jgi:pimeloyl-ACP methyl ester carboxylesterase
VTQKAAAEVCFRTALDQAAWHSLPSWYLVAEDDRMINPDAERKMATRTGATTIVMRGASHAAMFAHAPVIADAIKAAAAVDAKYRANSNE